MSDKIDLFITEDILDSLVKNTQKDAKNHFNNELKKQDLYGKKHELKSILKYKLVYKSNKKRLFSLINKVVYTNGFDELNEEKMPTTIFRPYKLVPWIGVDKNKLEIGDNVMLDIDAESTLLPVFCKILIVHHGAVRINSPPILARDVSIQVGTNCFLSTMSSLDQDSCKKRERKLSWAMVDEYYSLPRCQYSGKKSLKFEKSEQVEESMFPKPIDASEINNSKKLVYESKSIGTEDLIDHLKINSYTKLDLLSSLSLENASSQTNLETTETASKITSSEEILKKRYRKISNNYETKPGNKLIQIKRFEGLCPLTGTKRVTLLMPFLDANNNLNSNRMLNFDNSKSNLNFEELIEKYEEYYIKDASVDTEDLNKHFDFEKYSYAQLLSDTVSLDNDLKSILTLIQAPNSLTESDKVADIFNINKTSFINTVMNNLITNERGTSTDNSGSFGSASNHGSKLAPDHQISFISPFIDSFPPSSEKSKKSKIENIPPSKLNTSMVLPKKFSNKSNVFKDLISSIDNKLDRIKKISVKNKFDFDPNNIEYKGNNNDLGRMADFSEPPEPELVNNRTINPVECNCTSRNQAYSYNDSINEHLHYNSSNRYPLISRALGSRTPGLTEYRLNANKPSYRSSYRSDKYICSVGPRSGSEYLNSVHSKYNTNKQIRANSANRFKDFNYGQLTPENNELGREENSKLCAFCSSKATRRVNSKNMRNSNSEGSKLSFSKFDETIKNSNNFSTSTSIYNNYAHEYLNTETSADCKLTNLNIDLNTSRYFRSKYDKSLSMYANDDNKLFQNNLTNPGSNEYFSTTESDSEDAII